MRSHEIIRVGLKYVFPLVLIIILVGLFYFNQDLIWLMFVMVALTQIVIYVISWLREIPEIECYVVDNKAQLCDTGIWADVSKINVSLQDANYKHISDLTNYNITFGVFTLVIFNKKGAVSTIRKITIEGKLLGRFVANDKDPNWGPGLPVLTGDGREKIYFVKSLREFLPFQLGPYSVMNLFILVPLKKKKGTATITPPPVKIVVEDMFRKEHELSVSGLPKGELPREWTDNTPELTI